MKFKNVSDKVKMLKIDGEWVDVLPGRVVELSEAVARNEGCFEAVDVEDKPKEEVKEENKSKEELKEMTKDQLNDYAASVGLGKVSSRMRKADMVKAVLKHLKK